jgi:DNA modification methylase
MITTLTGDCRDMLGRFEDEHFDVIFTDPPIGMGSGWNALAFLQQYGLCRLLKPTGIVIIMTNPHHGYIHIQAGRWSSGAPCQYHPWSTLAPTREHGLNNVRPLQPVIDLMKTTTQSMIKPIVLDPFCGSGTTLLAAQHLGIAAVGIDIDPVCTATTKMRLL